MFTRWDYYFCLSTDLSCKMVSGVLQVLQKQQNPEILSLSHSLQVEAYGPQAASFA